jgi:hypothetical protein
MLDGNGAREHHANGNGFCKKADLLNMFLQLLKRSFMFLHPAFVTASANDLKIMVPLTAGPVRTRQALLHRLTKILGYFRLKQLSAPVLAHVQARQRRISKSCSGGACRPRRVWRRGCAWPRSVSCRAPSTPCAGGAERTLPNLESTCSITTT